MANRLTEYEQAPFLTPVIKGKTYTGDPNEKGLEIALKAGVNSDVAREILSFTAATEEQIIFSHQVVRWLAEASQTAPHRAIRKGIASVMDTILAGQNKVTVSGPAKRHFEGLRK